MTKIAPPTLAQQVQGAKLVIRGRIVHEDMVDGSGNQTTGRTGPGSPNRIRHHIAVDEVVYQHPSVGPESAAVQRVIIKRWGMWHNSLDAPRDVDLPPALFPVTSVDAASGAAVAVFEPDPAVDCSRLAEILAILRS